MQLTQEEAANLGVGSKSTLEVKGITEKNQVVFNFANPEQGFSQSFGISLKKYHGKPRSMWVDDRFGVAMLNTTESKLNLLREAPEGPYVFLPNEDDDMPTQFGIVDPDVTYQKGKLVEQWTILFKNNTPGGPENALIRVTYSPFSNDLIDFEVELSEVPIEDEQSRDVTVNWHMFEGFDPKGEFFTDSNGMQMLKRNKAFLRANSSQEANTIQNQKPNFYTISGNYYPVTSAIAMRDKSGNSSLQVTIMNDRPQGGSADLTEKATIELMQNRRTLYDDLLGLGEPLNETEANGHGIKVNAKYQMHIFDTSKGESMQRRAQADQMQSLQFFFAQSFEMPKKGGKGQALAAADSEVSLPESFIIRLFPLAKNHIEVRLENLDDKFDKNAATASINLKHYL